MEQIAIGFRVKSGWAMAVAVGKPGVILRRRVELADPGVPESAQPFHAGLELPGAEGNRESARLAKIVERFAARSLSEFLDECRQGGRRIVGIGIAVGSTVDPATISNDHIRAHASEGRLFREVIEKAAKSARLSTRVFVEKGLISEASQRLKMPEDRLKSDLKELGRPIGGRWRSEDKSAALSAWLVLASLE